jgi:hypothetical protein
MKQCRYVEARPPKVRKILTRIVSLCYVGFVNYIGVGVVAEEPCVGGGDLAVQVGEVSDETVVYGYGFCATLTSAHCTANYRPVLSSERVPYMKKKELSNKEN